MLTLLLSFRYRTISHYLYICILYRQVIDTCWTQRLLHTHVHRRRNRQIKYRSFTDHWLTSIFLIFFCIHTFYLFILFKFLFISCYLRFSFVSLRCLLFIFRHKYSCFFYLPKYSDKYQLELFVFFISIIVS